MDTTTVPALIVFHAIAASYVLVLGPVQILRPRRDRMHRILGRTWVVAIALTCLSSFGIRAGGGFSWLHALSVFTMVTVTLGVLGAIRHNEIGHRANMIGSYLGTVGAFVFAVAAPGRIIRQVTVSDPGSVLLVVALVLATSAALVLALWRTVGTAGATAGRATADVPA